MPNLTPEAWAQIRADYEHTERPIEDICAGHGISSGTLRDRVRRWHWTRRRQPIPFDGPPPVPPRVVLAPQRAAASTEADATALPAEGETAPTPHDVVAAPPEPAYVSPALKARSRAFFPPSRRRSGGSRPARTIRANWRTRPARWAR
jgi:hypothetical protein